MAHQIEGSRGIFIKDISLVPSLTLKPVEGKVNVFEDLYHH